jgi:hypothetical protein
MEENRVRRESRDAPISGPDFPGLEDGTGSGLAEKAAAAVEVDELGERGVHKIDIIKVYAVPWPNAS